MIPDRQALLAWLISFYSAVKLAIFVSMDVSIKPVSITEAARREVRKIMQHKDIPDDYGLRIGVRGGKGCAGVSFYLGFDKQKESDLTYHEEDIPVIISKRETMYLIGVELDFYDGSDARGFTFNKEQP